MTEVTELAEQPALLRVAVLRLEGREAGREVMRERCSTFQISSQSEVSMEVF